MRNEGRAQYAAKEEKMERLEKIALWSVAVTVLGKSSIGLNTVNRTVNGLFVQASYSLCLS